MKNKKIKIAIVILIIAIVATCSVVYFLTDKTELKTVKSEKQLEKLYSNSKSVENEALFNIISMPFSLFNNVLKTRPIMEATSQVDGDYIRTLDGDYIGTSESYSGLTTNGVNSGSSSKDYSTTNIQVENVDEADITKTDGDYIYSISGSNVIITNVINPEKIEISATIKSNNSAIPEDLIIYNNKLVVISTDDASSASRNYNTLVQIYDITDRTKPSLVKNYKLYEPYYTSRCIGNKLYVIASGKLKRENDKIITYYNEDNKQKNINFDNMKYLKDVDTNKQTLISMVDLNNAKEDVNISSYLIDISNAYVSEHSIYLLNQKYEGSSSVPPISSLFGLSGAFGPFMYSSNSNSYGYHTEIYKFDITENGSIEYSCKNKVKGKTINQYSIDEYDNNLRIAVYDNDGSRVVIFNNKLKEIGKTSYLAKGETMYSSRFMGNKAYLVTYRTIDPLYVIDLSDSTNPTVLGELKIPGYSTYLHPYDENHLIGIGMETEEVVNKNSNGKVISTTSKIIGMKMALFDVSDVNNPVEISNTVIGDRRTTSAILTNPKALLFSKEKELIAIPVNNYAKDFEISNSTNSYSSIINSYTNNSGSYISEGYLVYKINTDEGFSLKGIITHDSTKTNNKYPLYYFNATKLLRGLYIDNNLFTVSETAIKVNNLDSLDLVGELKIK